MPAPIYEEPIYISFDMIENQLGKMQIDITEDPDPTVPGMYKPVAIDLMAKGEAYILQTILSNYVQIPLETIDNLPFDSLYDNPKYNQTYTAIRDMFLSSAFWQIYKSYFSDGGTNNGKNIIEQYSNKISIYTNTYLRLDQAGNPLVKNAFAGLKPAANGSQRIAKSSRIPAIPQGRDQSYAAFNATPNLRWGFNK